MSNDKFVGQNRKNHERDLFHSSIISPILVELLRCTIPHFKALFHCVDLFKCNLALGVTVLGLWKKVMGAIS